MQKAVVIKQTWAIILMTPHYLLEASGVPAFTLQQGGWINVASFPGLHHSYRRLQYE